MSESSNRQSKSSFPIKTFQFNLDSSNETKKEIKSQLSSIDERISKIIEHFQIDDFPVVQVLLNMTHDKETLKGLSKALDRVADLVEVKDNLLAKLKVIEHAETDPSWFASTFGDFSEDLDNQIQHILGDNNG
jgi:hemoglobin-like flavoprotein